MGAAPKNAQHGVTGWEYRAMGVGTAARVSSAAGRSLGMSMSLPLMLDAVSSFRKARDVGRKVWW